MSPARLPLVPPQPGTTRILGATVIDGTGAEPLEDIDVEIRDGVITSVGATSPAASAADVVIDGRGAFVMPGFIDTHVHVTMPDASSHEMALWFAEEHSLATADIMRLTLEAGVTAARDLSGLTPGFRNAVARGWITGPRMHMSIALLSPTGGHADPSHANGTVAPYVAWEPIASGMVVDSDDEVIKAVRTLVRTGADVIKVCTTGGISTPTDSPDDLGLSEHQVRLIRDELARRGGRPIASHAQGHEGALNAVRGGTTSLEHGYDMSDELISALLAHGTVLVPTLSTLSLAPDPTKKSAEVVAKKLEWQERGRDAAARAISAGVMVAMGTDAGIFPQGRNLTELGHLVDAGLTPLQAIHAGTQAGARLLGLDDHIGTVRPGLLADLVVTEVNPLARIHDLADPAAVEVVLQAGAARKDRSGRAAGLGA
ncbi:amidohydrolase family protein [Demequina sp. NBRC 110055]|uniref:metal-dependent hydrolase family protein n=1 Tax=Demequina sp. NBRC 110055 TaxID=1570344 RepID=UPI001F22B7E9|nr:amidohydrolase family protein [Demequina sp. NBRC 110055]